MQTPNTPINQSQWDRRSARRFGLALAFASLAFVLLVWMRSRSVLLDIGDPVVSYGLLASVVCAASSTVIGVIERQGVIVLTGIFTVFVSLLGVLRLGIIDHEPSPEAAAPAGVRSINAAEDAYARSHEDRYASIEELVSAGLLDGRYLDGRPVYFYSYAIQVGPSDYTITATPVSRNGGRYGYYSNSDFVVRFATQASAICEPCFPQGLSGASVQ